jgi:hypothetical protein
LYTLLPLNALRPGGANVALIAFRAKRPGGTGVALRALYALNTLNALRTLQTLITLWAAYNGGVVYPLRPVITLQFAAYNAVRALGQQLWVGGKIDVAGGCVREYLIIRDSQRPANFLIASAALVYYYRSPRRLRRRRPCGQLPFGRRYFRGG